MTNRKSHTPFQLVPKSTTLVLEWLLMADTHSVGEQMRLSEATTKIWMKIDPYYHRQKCRPMSLSSGGIRFIRIFAEVPWRGASNDIELSGLSRTAIFSVFAGYFSGNKRWGQCFIPKQYAVRHRLFSDPNSQSAWPWMTLKWRHCLERLFRVEFCFCADLAGSDCATFEK